MKDFVQTMKDWRRMCSVCTCSNKEEMKDFPLCPIITQHMGYPCDECPQDWSEEATKQFEEIVTAWAAEHPVIYPTWEEWLQSVGVMESSEGLLRRIKGQLLIDGIPAHAVPTAKVLQPMDADIAQKLGIEPKEGV